MKTTVKDSKELREVLKEGSRNYFQEWTKEDLEQNAVRYLKAIKENRMLCTIPHVSKSGMSRVIKFTECSKGKTRYNFLNFNMLFLALGYKRNKNHEGYNISGCGMDMIFHTNYSIIHKLCRLGFINKKECEVLAQATPTVL